ncbi:MAG TPA: hypothetical protein VFB31_09355 [Pseudolabrys sp.]|nr:hypothetical protein [Pseudolabrys sp.]
MAKKARKKTKAAKARRAKVRRPAARPARKKTRKPAKVGTAFQIMIDTINETERLREKREQRGSDETE